MRAFRIIQPGTLMEWNWHLDCIGEHLEALLRGDLQPGGPQKLAINLPPRCLKSTFGSILFPAWGIGRNPSEQFICTSYKFELAKDMAMKCRDVMQDDWYKQCFPETRIDNTQNEKHNFRTTKMGMYYSAPIHSVTGKGASVVILDDPLNPMEAMSPTIRNNTNSVIRSTLPTRFNDPRKAKWLLIQQRLHDDDPTGNLTKDGTWHTLKLPAEAKKSYHIDLRGKEWVMEEGDLLFPTRLTPEVLEGFRRDMTEYNYVAQMLQEPIPVGGGEFKNEWIQYYTRTKPKEMNVYILCDAAGGDEMNKRKKKQSDYTAFVVVGLAPDKNYYLLDIVRDRLNPTERVETLFILHRKWNEICGRPPKVGYEKYGMMTDTHYIMKRQDEENYRFPLVELGGQMMKEERIRQLIPPMQRGQWYFPASLMYVDNEGRSIDLVRELVDGEMMTFPRSRFDDCLDGMSRVLSPELYAVFPDVKLDNSMYDDNTTPSSGDWQDW